MSGIVDHLWLLAARTHCKRVLRRFMNATTHASKVQQRVLQQHIALNASSEYGQHWGFDKIRDIRDFRRQVPLQTYTDFVPYIERLKQGQHQALFGSGQKVLMFALTSGTSLEPKYIPVTSRFLKNFRAGWNAFGVKSLLDHAGCFLRPIVQITSRMDESWTEARIPCGSISGLMAATQKALVKKYYVSPLSVAYIDDPTSRYYAVMRLAMMTHNPAFMVTANPATHVKLAKTAAQFAPQLIRDIRDGSLWSELDVPKRVRQELSTRMVPNPKRAEELSALLQTHNALLPKHYWDLGFLCNWTGGTLGLHLQEFPHYFGDTPVRDIGLLASEGRMSIPVADHTAAGILEVTGNFFEFIPAEQVDAHEPDTLLCHELVQGHEYFVVLTNASGLTRYCIGDRVRVQSFCGQAPVIEFLDKGAHVSSVTGEKLTENQVVNAVNETMAALQLPITNYVVSPVWDDPPFYRLHIELATPVHGTELQVFKDRVDAALAQHNIEYAAKQKSHRLGPLRLNTLPSGTLEQRDLELSRRYRKNNEQYKHQFLLTAPGSDTEFPKDHTYDTTVA